MSAFTAAVLTITACLAAGTVLVLTEHYGWAWIPFLLAGCLQFKESSCGCGKEAE